MSRAPGARLTVGVLRLTVFEPRTAATRKGYRSSAQDVSESSSISSRVTVSIEDGMLLAIVNVKERLFR